MDPVLDLEHAVPFASSAHGVLVLLVLFGRAMDLLSTWMVTPSLALEANPVARRLGWRGGVAVSCVAALVLGLLPLAAISVTTTSLLVAARNAQSAWLVRSLGEQEYRQWIAARYRSGSRATFLAGLAMNSVPFALIGAGLLVYSRWQLVPFSVGLGLVVYALAVALYTGLTMRRVARMSVPSADWAAPEVRE